MENWRSYMILIGEWDSGPEYVSFVDGLSGETSDPDGNSFVDGLTENDCFFKCASSDSCVSRHEVCDSFPDCPDGSDELSSLCGGPMDTISSGDFSGLDVVAVDGSGFVDDLTEEINQPCLMPPKVTTNQEKLIFDLTCQPGLEPIFTPSQTAKGHGLEFEGSSLVSKHTNTSLLDVHQIVFSVLPEWKEKALPQLFMGQFDTQLTNVSYDIIYYTPNKPPVIKGFTIRIEENVMDNRTWPVTGTDPDDGIMGRVTLKTMDMPSQLQLINDTDGQSLIVLRRPFDAETITNRRDEFAVIRFVIIATDGGGLSSEGSFIVYVHDTNDNSPECNSGVTVGSGRFGPMVGWESGLGPQSFVEPALHFADISGELPYVIDIGRYCSDPDISGALRQPINFVNKKDCNGALQFIHDFPFKLMLRRRIPDHVITCDVSVFVTDGTYGTVFQFDIAFNECPAELDNNGYNWTVGIPGRDTFTMCPAGYTGVAKRRCDTNGVYLDPLYNCTSDELETLVQEVTTSKINSTEALAKMKSYTTESIKTKNKTMYAGDLQKLALVLTKLQPPTTNEENTTADFFDVVNNLIADETSDNWKAIVNETGYGAERLLQGVDSMVEKIVKLNKSGTSNREFAKSNFYLSLETRDNCQEAELEFPDKSGRTVPDWTFMRADNIRVKCHENVLFSSAIYRNVSKILSSQVSENPKFIQTEVVNAPLMSLSLFPGHDHNISVSDDNPVTLTFQLYDKTLGLPVCSYWNFSNRGDGSGNWATDGCVLDRFDQKKGLVICKCSHLTNFAVLMSPSPQVVEHINALSVITWIGCVASMICLVITVAVHILVWRDLSSDRSVILMCMCSTLFVAYLVFLSGIKQTRNKVACTAVAVLLHFLFLSVFFLMLALGFVLFKSVQPTRHGRLAHRYITAAFIAPLVIVGVCTAATQFRGYGNDLFCWLTVDSWLIWAFLGPVIGSVLANAIVIGIVLKTILGGKAMKKKKDKEKAMTGARSLMIMVPVLGVTWIFGIFAVNEDTVIFQYLFAIFNSCQGVLIMVTNCFMNKQIMKAVQRHVPTRFTTSVSSQEFSSTAVSSSDAKSTKGTSVTTM